MHLESLLPRTGLALDAAGVLERSIREGSLAPGDRLPSEAEIARQLGVSRPVVREAIAHLRADGLVESRRGLGLFVNKPDTLRLRVTEIEASHDSILEFLEFRLGLEVEAARFAALRRTAEDLRRIEAAFDELKRVDELGLDSAEQDLAFHLAISDAAHNRLYQKVLQFVSGPLLNSIRDMRAKDAGAQVHVDIRLRDHSLILDRIKAGDAEGAGSAMREHIAQSYGRYASQLAPAGSSSKARPGKRPHRS
ncbi:MAG: FadR family transcriptional regulator [Rhizobiales bacterium]|nr:FadR family transcriptional regulator [Hyphomicrobiales bacterium]